MSKTDTSVKRRCRRATAAIGLALCAASCMPMNKPALTAADADDAAHIEAYLNARPRFEAQFTQSGSFGAGSGLIWLDRPGHLRIDYAGPGARLMVIAGGRVRILDRASSALTTMPVSRTPLGLLLAPAISLTGEARVESLVHQDGQIRLVVTKANQPAQGRLTLDFADQPLRLEAVSVTDAAGRTLTMQLSMIDAQPVLTPELFAPPSPDPGSQPPS